jgi:hypothetical protein
LGRKKESDTALTPAWPADKVERRSVASLVPYARNPRTHSPAQVDQIAASIREWGWSWRASCAMEIAARRRVSVATLRTVAC